MLEPKTLMSIHLSNIIYYNKEENKHTILLLLLSVLSLL
jgi:hypothetical protein